MNTKQKTKLHCAMDLHSNNVVVVVTDHEGKVLLKKRVSNDLSEVLRLLKPFGLNIPAVAIESTYNWYWLADGLEDQGYEVRLVNTVAVKSYSGDKYTDDVDDALFLCELQAMNRLPTGYVYPRETRSIRDMLRRRSLFVRHRTALILSLQGLFARQTGRKYSLATIIKLENQRVLDLLKDHASVQTAKFQAETCAYLTNQIKQIERFVLKQVDLRPEFQKLRTIPGIGPILGLTIMLETGDISRFRKCGNFVSYCRCAPSRRMSNEKTKGRNNTKNGNPYLSWAFIEAAARSLGNCASARTYYDRKMRRTKIGAVAMKSTAAKLCKAAFFIMRDAIDFDESKAFGQ
jgi:transposase